MIPRYQEADILFDLSIPLRFGGNQPNAYRVENAVSTPVQSGNLVGDTRRGGSCNFEQYTLIPHCCGTHTECVGHITRERISVRDCLRDAIMRAVLISVNSETINGDRQITAQALIDSLKEQAAVSENGHVKNNALIVRTLPNNEDKLTARYDGKNIPPYFTADAMEFIVRQGFGHLLVDLPSIDRLFDDGKLLNHRIFWNIEEGSFDLGAKTRIHSTITELIYVPNEVPDGEYLFNLQIAPFDSDAAPSRPVLLKAPE